MPNQKAFSPILVVTVLAVVLAVLSFWIYRNYPYGATKPQEQIACTMDAKICPDGSSVGRSGPRCEFAACPKVEESSSSADISDWKTYENLKYGYSIRYPSNWSVFGEDAETYISVVNEKDLGLSLVGTPLGLKLDYIQNKNNLSALDYVNKVVLPENEERSKAVSQHLTPDSNPKNIKIQTGKAGEEEFVRIEGLNNITAGVAGNEGPEIYFARNNKIIKILGAYNHKEHLEGYSEVKENFSQILSTFKFTQ